MNSLKPKSHILSVTMSISFQENIIIDEQLIFMVPNYGAFGSEPEYRF